MAATSESHTADVMGALVDVTAIFQELAGWLATQDGADTSDFICRMSRVERIEEDAFAIGRGNGFEFEWYAWADFDSKASILSIGMTVSWDASAWLLASSVTARSAHQEEVVLWEAIIDINDRPVVPAMRRLAKQIYDERAHLMVMFRARSRGHERAD
jgi:hypothetical protein